jgi:hypothetical protein
MEIEEDFRGVWARKARPYGPWEKGIVENNIAGARFPRPPKNNRRRASRAHKKSGAIGISEADFEIIIFHFRTCGLQGS